jgi:Holliday junction resolvase RusA-like endonuclease
VDNEGVTLYFEVPPVAKQRARVARGWAYTPKKTADFELSVKLLAQSQWKRPQWGGPISVSITFVLPRPKARRKELWVSVRPDLDNYVKSILDALNGVVWEDDGQVCEMYATKRYETEDVSPRIVVKVVSLPT